MIRQSPDQGFINAGIQKGAFNFYVSLYIVAFHKFGKCLVVVAATDDLLYGRPENNSLHMLVSGLQSKTKRTYMFILGRVRALDIAKWRVILHNT